MLESGVKLGVSSRGSGNVDDMSGKVSDFEIVTGTSLHNQVHLTRIQKQYMKE
jgi:hypothetical protein